MNCSVCQRRVPSWLTDAVPGAEWCSGACLRRAFIRAITDLARVNLTPEQFEELSNLSPHPRLGDLATPGSIREAITSVTDHLLSSHLQPKQASILLYALQTAISTIRLATEQGYASADADAPPSPAVAGFAPKGERHAKASQPRARRRS